ncbi:MAG TPA: hypothetical protein PKC18_14895 [Lacipirellulaceae bacterium]|nr:hypothetical protein [Lacipirellulaceae bacterium]HMP08042.1 hypothetical protein [Lacipirellulaceae bacterium]
MPFTSRLNRWLTAAAAAAAVLLPGGLAPATDGQSVQFLPILDDAVANAAAANAALPGGGFDLARFVPGAVADVGEPEEIVGEPLADPARIFRPITDLTIDGALPAGIAPGDPGVEVAGGAPTPWPRIEDARFWGGWGETNHQWSATRLCHRPLYFEQVNLERYGYTVSPLLQPAISGAHFFLTIPALPYKMVAQPPRECVYTLGYYRAGSPAPRRWHHMTWDPTAATVEGLLVTGLVFLIP